MYTLPEVVTSKFNELFGAVHYATDDLKIAGAEANLIGDFPQVAVINETCRTLQELEAEIKAVLKKFQSRHKPRFNKFVVRAPLLAKSPVNGYQTQRRIGSWYITTHVNKQIASKVLEEIGKELNVPVQIEIVEGFASAEENQ